MTSPAAPDAGPSRGDLSRRRVLAATVAAAGAAAIGAGCRGRAPHPDADLDAAAHGLTLENSLASTYETVRALLTEAKLGAKVPDAILTFVITAADHHHKTAEAWTSVLRGAGRSRGAAPDPALRRAVDTVVTRLTDTIAAADLGLRLEDYAAQAYQAAIPTLRRPDVIKVAAQAVVVAAQRQATLRYIVGLYPVGSGPTAPADPASYAFAPAAPTPALVTD